MSSPKVDRFTSNQDQNDHRPILHIVEYISSAEMFCFVIICNQHYCAAGSYVAEVTWPCTYLFTDYWYPCTYQYYFFSICYSSRTTAAIQQVVATSDLFMRPHRVCMLNKLLSELEMIECSSNY